MKSNARTPAKTIKKIYHPWSVAMMKKNAWPGELRLSIGQSQCNGDAGKKILRHHHGAHKMSQHVEPNFNLPRSTGKTKEQLSSSNDSGYIAYG
jgi:hypothetical protein